MHDLAPQASLETSSYRMSSTLRPFKGPWRMTEKKITSQHKIDGFLNSQQGVCSRRGKEDLFMT